MSSIPCPLSGLPVEGSSMILGSAVTGVSLLLTIRAGRDRRYQPLYSTLFSLTCLFGSAILISFLQILFPEVGAQLEGLAPLFTYAVGWLVGVVCLMRARYSEEAQALTLFLGTLMLALLVVCILHLLPMLGAPNVIALSVAWSSIEAIALIPYSQFRARLVCSPHPQPATFPTRGPTLGMTAFACVATALCGLGLLSLKGQLALLRPSWGPRTLPTYTALATCVIIHATPFGMNEL